MLRAPAQAPSIAAAWASVFGKKPLPAQRSGVLDALDALGQLPASPDSQAISRLRAEVARIDEQAYQQVFALARQGGTLEARLGRTPGGLATDETRAASERMAGRPVLAPGQTVAALGAQIRVRKQLHDHTKPNLALSAIAQRAATFVDGVAKIEDNTVTFVEGSQVKLLIGRPKDGLPSVLSPGANGKMDAVFLASKLAVTEAEVEIARRLAEARAMRIGEDHELAGDLAELAVKLNLFTAADQHPEVRGRFAEEIESLSQPLVANVKDPIALEHAVGWVLAEQIRRMRFLQSSSYRPDDPGPSRGVRLWGGSTRLDEAGSLASGTPGHIMATDFADGVQRGAHYSFGPEQRDRTAPVDPSKPLSIPAGQTPEVGPFPGAQPFPNRVRSGALFDFATDPYREHVDWSYVFDPKFLSPEAFNRAALSERALAESDPGGRDYVLATSSLDPKQQDTVAVDPNARGATVGLHRPTGRRVPLDVRASETIVPACNCVTNLLSLLSRLRTPDGEDLLGERGFEVLGLRLDGSAHPGRDLRPQDLFEHLRYREHRWRNAPEGDG